MGAEGSTANEDWDLIRDTPEQAIARTMPVTKWTTPVPERTKIKTNIYRTPVNSDLDAVSIGVLNLTMEEAKMLQAIADRIQASRSSMDEVINISMSYRSDGMRPGQRTMQNADWKPEPYGRQVQKAYDEREPIRDGRTRIAERKAAAELAEKKKLDDALDPGQRFSGLEIE